jgi:hypothetical protein
LKKNDENPEAQFQCTPSWVSFQSIPLTTTGSQDNSCQDVNPVLKLFGKRTSSARKGYRAFVEEGISMGKRPELTGGGLIRSMGSMCRVSSRKK